VTKRGSSLSRRSDAADTSPIERVERRSPIPLFRERGQKKIEAFRKKNRLNPAYDLAEELRSIWYG
jgi:hypothetical protein